MRKMPLFLILLPSLAGAQPVINSRVVGDLEVTGTIDGGTISINALGDLAGGLCGTTEILEDQGSSWACIATPTGGGSTPSGTGYRHVTVGVEDAASKLIDLTAATDVAANQGTTTTVLHGNAAGQASFGSVSLAADVSGDLPFASFVQASAISKLLGRGSAAGAGDFEEITLGTNLAMSGTTLNATGGGGAPTTSEYVTTQDDAGLSADVFPSADDQIASSDSSSSGSWKTLANGAVAYATASNTFSQAGIPGLASSTSSDLRTVLSDEVGTGAAMFGLTTDMADGLACSGDQVVKRNAGDTAFECGTVAGGSGLTHPQVMARISLGGGY